MFSSTHHQEVVELLGGDHVEEIVSGPEGEECELVLCRRDDSLVEYAAEGGEDVDVELRTVGDGVGVDLGVPVASDGSDLELLRKQVEEDDSLKHRRCLASSESQPLLKTRHGLKSFLRSLPLQSV